MFTLRSLQEDTGNAKPLQPIAEKSEPLDVVQSDRTLHVPVPPPIQQVGIKNHVSKLHSAASVVLVRLLDPALFLLTHKIIPHL